MAILSKINLKNTQAIIKEAARRLVSISPKKRLFAILTLTLILFVVPIHQAQAIDVLGGISAIIQTVLFAGPYALIWIFTGIMSIFVFIATYLINAALSPAIYMAIINSPAIDRGWTIMRDTANLFFILILIFIALATTLRLQSYSAKTWIPKLLFGAVFINFSKTITMFIIDIGNMFMYGAISWMGQGLENTGIGQLNWVALKLFTNLNPVGAIITGGITLSKLVEIFAAFMFNLVLFLSLFGFGLLLIIRVTMLAILTIFSPIAYMLHAWPNAGKYAGQWWGSLLKYIVFGPIIVFFLFIAGEMANTLFGLGAFAIVPAGAIGETGVSYSDFLGIDGFLGNLIPFVIVIIILLSGISFTSEMGIAGAGMIMGTVKGLAAGGGLIVGGLAAKSVFDKGRRGAGWAKGAWDASKKGGLRGQGGLWDYGKKTAKGIPGQFVGGVKDPFFTAGREVKDQATMAYNKYQEKQRKAAEDRAKALNMSGAEAEKRRDNAKTPEEAAGYQRYLDLKGKSMFPGEQELMDEIEKRKKNNPADPQIPILEASLRELQNLNKNKVEKIVKISLQGGIDKGEFANSHPELAPLINGRTIEEQVSKMTDEGISQNKVGPDAYKNKEYLQASRKIAYDNDPDKFNNHLKNRSKEVQNNSQRTLDELLADAKAQALRDGQTNINFDPEDPTGKGYENFQNAASAVFLKRDRLEEIFERQGKAIENFAAHFYKDLDKLSSEDIKTVFKHINKTTLARIHVQNLNPADAKLGADTIKIHRKGSEELKYILSNEAWGGKRATPKNADYEPDENDVWNNLNNPPNNPPQP